MGSYRIEGGPSCGWCGVGLLHFRDYDLPRIRAGELVSAADMVCGNCGGRSLVEGINKYKIVYVNDKGGVSSKECVPGHGSPMIYEPVFRCHVECGGVYMFGEADEGLIFSGGAPAVVRLTCNRCGRFLDHRTEGDFSRLLRLTPHGEALYAEKMALKAKTKVKGSWGYRFCGDRGPSCPNCGIKSLGFRREDNARLDRREVVDEAVLHCAGCRKDVWVTGLSWYQVCRVLTIPWQNVKVKV